MQTKFDIFLTLVVVFLTAYLGVSNNSDWYRNEVKTKVVPKFFEAYKALAEGVIDTLVLVDINDVNNETAGEAVLKETIDGINCGVSAFRKKMSEARNQDQLIQEQLSNEISGLILDVSRVEQQIGNAQREVAAREAEIMQIEEQLRVADQVVRDKENEVNGAEQAVGEAERAVERSRSCGLKRWFRFRRIIRFIVRPICSVVNMDGIRNAKNRRSDAYRYRDEARNRLEATRNQLDDARRRLGEAQNRLNNARNQVTNLQVRLADLQRQQTNLANVTGELRQVSLMVSTILASGEALESIVRNLTDFEVLIAPLNGIYTEFSSIDFIQTSENATIPGMIDVKAADKVKENLDLLKDKLANLPFNENPTNGCSVSQAS